MCKSNRNVRHPVNTTLNYGDAILRAQIKMQNIAEALDPAIGRSDNFGTSCYAFVLDRTEPLRPVVDQEILKLIFSEAFSTKRFCHR